MNNEVMATYGRSIIYIKTPTIKLVSMGVSYLGLYKVFYSILQCLFLMSIYYTDSALFVIVYFCGNIDDLIGVSVVIVALKEHLYLL